MSLRQLRKRLADSPRLNAAVAGAFAGWIRWVRRSSVVSEDGWPEVADALREHGAVIIVCWHQRLMMTPYMFDLSAAPCRSLTSDRRAGRLFGRIHASFGFETMPMPRHLQGAGEMRAALKGLRQGFSIGISPDGPQGPARVAKTTPIQWARVSGAPVFIFTFSARRYLRWPTWDRLMFPLPYTRLALRWRRWPVDLPQRLSTEEAEALAADLGRAMDDLTAEADAAVGHDAPQT